MAQIVPVAVGPDYAIRFRVSLEGVAIVLGLRWHDRASGWYLTLTDAEGVVRVRGRRIEPGCDLMPDRTFGGLPPGRLVAVGSVDLTRREYLGTAVQVLYLTAAEVAT